MASSTELTPDDLSVGRVPMARDVGMDSDMMLADSLQEPSWIRGWTSNARYPSGRSTTTPPPGEVTARFDNPSSTTMDGPTADARRISGGLEVGAST